jgi:hypothetical protein
VWDVSFIHSGQSLGEKPLSRRQWLQIGVPGALSMAVPRAGVAATKKSGRARSVLLIYASGGQSQLETWDPKPDAPAEIRGAFGSIQTPIPGLRLCEHMPQLARLAPLYTVLRSVSHDDRDHGSATYLALTGHYHQRKSGNPPVRPTDMPTYGAIMERLRRERRLPASRLPFAAVHVNGPAIIPEILGPGQFAGLLGKGCEPVLVGDPTQSLGPVADLDELPDVPASRVQGRRSLLETLDSHCRLLEQNRTTLEARDVHRQAYELLSSRSMRQAFDLGQESERVRRRYGLHRSGQSCLLARRLVEAGVPWITVIWNHSNRGQDKMPDNSEAFGWDTHNDIFAVCKDHLLPRFDQSLSALLSDLEDRRLLEQTLVVCMGEFGRSPRVTKQERMAGNLPGRDHWPDVYSIMLAGAGVTRGGILGASDRQAGAPTSTPVGPWDVAATMFHALGIDPEAHYQDPTNRPFPITTGKPILKLFS